MIIIIIVLLISITIRLIHTNSNTDVVSCIELFTFIFKTI